MLSSSIFCCASCILADQHSAVDYFLHNLVAGTGNYDSGKPLAKIITLTLETKLEISNNRWTEMEAGLQSQFYDGTLKDTFEFRLHLISISIFGCWISGLCRRDRVDSMSLRCNQVHVHVTLYFLFKYDILIIMFLLLVYLKTSRVRTCWHKFTR